MGKRKHATAAKKQRKRRRNTIASLRSLHHLPDDLLPEILRFLPVKSLLRFRCVSKQLLALVDDDAHFARLHLDAFKNNRDKSRFLCVETRLRQCSIRCADTFQLISRIRPTLKAVQNGSKWFDIVSSVDGLVLLRYRLHSLKLWNPSLRRSLVVPPIPSTKLPLRNKTIGLGYDPQAKDYKIVLYIHHYSDVLASVAIYIAGSWKIIPIRPSKFESSGRHWIPESSGSAYLQGSLYFFATDKYNSKARVLLSFDLSNEVFSHIRLPAPRG